MRYAIPILFLILALFVLQSLVNNIEQYSPEKEAAAFLADIQSGNLSKTVRHFGTNVCHCPKKKGWGAYLSYQTDEEPNLAFLLGHSFTIGEINTRAISSPPQASHGVPWEQPEDKVVTVAIGFNASYSPIFLPLYLAYGKSMKLREFQEFLRDPAFEYWKSFTLRLRSGLGSDAIKLDTGSIDGDVRGEFKFALLPEKQEKNKPSFLLPSAAGPVIMPNGREVSQEKIRDALPRLDATIMELKVVRSSKWQPWTIAEFEFIDSFLKTNNGKLIRLKNTSK